MAYNSFPKHKVKAKYGFEPAQHWLDHVRFSSACFNKWSLRIIVSADGLTITNHHVGAQSIQRLSTGRRDDMKTGFYAHSLTDEAKRPDLELNPLLTIEDVTVKVNAAVKPEMSVADAGQARRAALSDIEKSCAVSTGLRCDVVTLYAGRVYNLYEYKKYTDVRLVFAPEFDAAFFGGDPDNFNYPRYDLDAAFFRVYENGKPGHLNTTFIARPLMKRKAPGAPQGVQRLAPFAYHQFIMRRWVLATLLIATVAIAQQTHNQYEPPNTPGAGQKLLAQFAGDWEVDVLPNDWGADRDQGDVQAVHDSGRQVSAVRFHVLQF